MAYEYKYSINRQLLGRSELICDRATISSPKDVLEIVGKLRQAISDNLTECAYLKSVYLGEHEILAAPHSKNTRFGVDNRVVENLIKPLVDFKVGYLLNDSVQYLNVKNIDTLFPKRFRDKDNLDIVRDMYITGVGYRWVKAGGLSPETTRLKAHETFVIYSNDTIPKPLIAGKLSSSGMTLFTTKYQIVIEKKTSDIVTLCSDLEKNYKVYDGVGYIPIFEYTLNDSRQGLVEVCLPLNNAIEKLSSDVLNALEQSVKPLLVLLNGDLDLNDLERMIELGIVRVTSSIESGGKADFDFLKLGIDYSGVENKYQSILTNLYFVAGVPLLQGTGRAETGTAVATTNGWVHAETIIKQEELAFFGGEYNMLSVVLPLIGVVDVGNVELNIIRNKSDNLAVKTQALVNLTQAGVAPEDIVRAVGLWSDSKGVAERIRNEQENNNNPEV